MEISAKQKQILLEILQETNKKDDGFDQPLPTVKEVLGNSGTSNNLYLIIIGAVLITIWVLYNTLGSSEQPKEKPAEKKKKRE